MLIKLCIIIIMHITIQIIQFPIIFVELSTSVLHTLSQNPLIIINIIIKLRKYRLKPVSGPVSVPVKGRKGSFFKKLKRYTDTDPKYRI